MITYVFLPEEKRAKINNNSQLSNNLLILNTSRHIISTDSSILRNFYRKNEKILQKSLQV